VILLFDTYVIYIGAATVIQSFKPHAPPQYGKRLVLSCLASVSNIRISLDGQNLNCTVTTANATYICTVVRKQLQFNHGIRTYTCSASPVIGPTHNKTLQVTPKAGIVIDKLELGVELGSKATLRCLTKSFTTDIWFEKLSNGKTLQITNSSNQMVSSANSNADVSQTTLTFLNFTQSNVGVYICKADYNSQQYSSQEMIVFPFNGKTSLTAVHSGTITASPGVQQTSQTISGPVSNASPIPTTGH
jgi:hypothetical protein